METIKITHNRADVLKAAWQLIKKAGLSFGEALQKAYNAIRLKLALNKASQEGRPIRFKKVDGSIREARATRNPEYIPTDKAPKGVKADSGLTIPFFDLDVNDWRSFRVDMLLA